MVLDGKKEWQIVKNIKLRIFSHELSSINFEVRFEIGLKVTLSLSVSLSLSPSFTRSSLFSLTPLSHSHPSLSLSPLSHPSLSIFHSLFSSLSRFPLILLFIFISLTRIKSQKLQLQPIKIVVWLFRAR